jgi:5-methylcytosine-specific restriction enzyme subunit McrC
VRTFHLLEHERAELPLSLDQATQLAGTPHAGLAVSPGRSPGTWWVKAASNVGVVTVDGAQVHIRSKIGVRNVLRLLDDGGRGGERWLPDEFGYDIDDDLLTAMVHVFAVALDRALAQGLRRDYVAVREDLRALRGRIDFARLAHRPAAGMTAPCAYDDHTADIPLNRLLLAAARRALAIPGATVRDRRSLNRSLGAFEGVATVGDPLVWLASWVPSRLDAHCERAVRLGALLLRHLSISDRSGGTVASTFLVDMDRLVESFLTTQLKRRLPGHLVLSAQHRTTLDHGARVQIRPDLVVKHRGEPVFVADVKYKAVGSIADVSTSDLYQLAAYAGALGVPGGALITCGAGVTGSDEIRVRGSDVRLQVWPVDLTGTSQQLSAALDRLGERLVGEWALRSQLESV